MRIDRWLREHAPAVFGLLRAPATPAALEAYAHAVGRPLPEALLEAYRAHDGVTGEALTMFGANRAPRGVTWARFMTWLPAVEAPRQYRMMRDLGVGWDAGWLVLGEDGGGNVLIVDAGSAEVLAWDHETGEASHVAPDLRTWMAWLADDMEAGLVVTDEDEGEEALLLLDAPPKAPPPAPEVSAERTAQVLLDVLAERQFIAMEPEVDPAPLVKKLVKALSVRAEEQRREQVIALLESEDAVAEVFADDEELGVVIDEFG
ncbi:SMI1/KNR4 family protein [Chondromyces apiculatus]|uniref:SMI1/KNR4 family protein n=1 Tax=Chondromyces apiculatus TaxID=51 RepID=UPI0018CC7177|nr:SMI1/KNR4 family protein [Chondromyces apiculatus]